MWDTRYGTEKYAYGKEPNGFFSAQLDVAILLADFAQLEIGMLEKQQIILNEGPFHQGEASVIRFHGIKAN